MQPRYKISLNRLPVDLTCLKFSAKQSLLCFPISQGKWFLAIFQGEWLYRRTNSILSGELRCHLNEVILEGIDTHQFQTSIN
jgi:hypothetical protein